LAQVTILFKIPRSQAKLVQAIPALFQGEFDWFFNQRSIIIERENPKRKEMADYDSSKIDAAEYKQIVLDLIFLGDE